MRCHDARYTHFLVPFHHASVLGKPPHRKRRVTEATPLDQIVLPRTRQDRIPLGIFYMVGATVLFAVSTAIAKWQVALYPINEVLFFRSIASLVVCALLILPRTGFGVYRTQRFGHHIMRGVAQTYAQTFILVALSLMPIAGAMAINFSAPLFATLTAALFLREKVGAMRLGALFVGFAGVLLVASPGADSFQLGASFAIASKLPASLYTRTVSASRISRGAQSAGARKQTGWPRCSRSSSSWSRQMAWMLQRVWPPLMRRGYLLRALGGSLWTGSCSPASTYHSWSMKNCWRPVRVGQATFLSTNQRWGVVVSLGSKSL